MSTEILDIRKVKAKNSDNIAVFVPTGKKHQNHHSQPHNVKKPVETKNQWLIDTKKTAILKQERCGDTENHSLPRAEAAGVSNW